MVCTANDLSAWKDFPKGLRVLLLDEDTNSAAEIKSKLEAMDYIVSTFCNENEALSAISGKPESFHVAIVEVSSSNSDGNFRFLETAKDLPTIMTSNVHCLSTMMKCIALGAVEFLCKPLSEDKLSNIWQHVVHKAFSAGGSILPESPKPVKDSVVSMLQLEVESEEHKEKSTEKTENLSPDHVDDYEQSQANDKYPAPSTPQLKQGGRLLDDGDCQDHTNCSTEKESAEQEGESKSVENTCRVDEVILDKGHPQSLGDTVLKTEDELADGVKGENNSCLQPQKGENNSCGHQVNRKKLKVDWTHELHKKFVQAVEQLGVDQAIPSRILEVMKVEGLNRHNVASHLQKYRMQTRNILPKQDEGRWLRPRDQIQRSYYPHRPIMAYPPYHSGHKFPHGPPVYPLWGAAATHPVIPQMWGPPSYPPWTPAESWHWKPYPGMQADAWGCPVMPFPPPQGPFPTFPQATSEFQRAADNASSFPLDSVDLQPAEEVIDKVVKEAINKPWLPLPLGLKPPSTDSVLAELSRQGISTVPPHHHQRL